LCVIYRFDLEDGGKEYRPYNMIVRAWKGLDTPRPLFGLERLSELNGAVFMAEGEKAANALRAAGFVATTCMNGANGISKTDLSPLAGRSVIVWHDNDPPGRKFLFEAIAALDEIGAASIRVLPIDSYPGIEGDADEEARMLEFPAIAPYSDDNLPIRIGKGWDAADLVRLDPAKARIRIRALIDITIDPLTMRDEIEPDSQPLPVDQDATPGQVDSDWRHIGDCIPDEWPEPDRSILKSDDDIPQFPLEVLGPYWSEWARNAGEGASAPPDYVVGTLLAVASSLIGNSRTISPWDGWTEPSILWIANVGSPSSGKSPAMSPVLDALRALEQKLVPEFEECFRQYKADCLAANVALEEWEGEAKANARGGIEMQPMPVEATMPLKPERPRLSTTDATTEAMVRLLVGQPRGILFYRDELAGFFANFDRYNSSRGGDRAFWLEAYGARRYAMDRVKNEGQPIVVPRLSVSIVGSIQPDRLQTLLMSGDDDGLPARFLYFYPTPVGRNKPVRSADAAWAQWALSRLGSLDLVQDEDGELVPRKLLLSDAAEALFSDWWSQQQDRGPESGKFAAWWGKGPGFVLRLALALEMLWWSANVDYAEPERISRAAIDMAIKLYETYLAPMARRVYGEFSISDDQHSIRLLANELIKRQEEKLNKRDVYVRWGLKGLDTATRVGVAIEGLVKAGWVRRETYSPGAEGGRRPENFLVNPRLFQN
jgi:hypothetical protein